MSKKMAIVLITYGVVMAGLGMLLHQKAPLAGKISYMACFVGGGLSLLWAVAAIAGMKGRAWATLSATATTAVLLTQAVGVWMPSSGEEANGWTLRLLVSAMFILTVGIVLYLFHGERSPEFYERRTSGSRDPSSGKIEGRSSGGGWSSE